MKNANYERIVPLHSGLIAEGFVEFAKRISSGSLFAKLKPDRIESRGGTGTKLIGRWVRPLGLVDPRLSPIAPARGWPHCRAFCVFEL